MPQPSHLLAERNWYTEFIERVPRKRRICEKLEEWEIIEASKAGNIEDLEEMLGWGYDFKLHNPNLLHVALEQGGWEVVEPLYKEYANSSAEDMGYPLHTAILSGCENSVKAILKYMPELLNVTDSKGVHPLMTALNDRPICHGIINSLLDAGVDPDATDDCQKNALHHIACNGNLTSVPCLLEKSKDINAKDASGKTPLFLAVETGKEENVRILLNHGADPTIVDKNNILPLTVAVEHLGIAKILAEVTPHDRALPAIARAALKKQYTCLEYFVKKGFPVPKPSLGHTFYNIIEHPARDISCIIKFLIENGVVFNNLAEFDSFPSAANFSIHKNSMIALCNLGFVESTVNQERRSQNEIETFLADQYDVLHEHHKSIFLLRNFEIYMKYYPFVTFRPDNDNDTLTINTITSTVPKLAELCRWTIRSRIVSLHGFVSMKIVKPLPLPNPLKKLLCSC